MYCEASASCSTTLKGRTTKFEGDDFAACREIRNKSKRSTDLGGEERCGVEIPEVLLWTPSLRFLFPRLRPFPSRKEYLDMLEEYKNDPEEELKEIEKEIEETKKSL